MFTVAVFCADLNPPLTVDPNQIAAENQSDLHVIDKGSGVVRAQILLARAHFSCGQIDGSFGTNLEKTVSAFQQVRNLPVSGAVDTPTWAALNQDSAPLLISYTISDEDEKGPFVQIPKDILQQAKLRWLVYRSPLDELAEHFHSSPDLLGALNPGANFSKSGQSITVPNVIVMPPGPPGDAARVVVSKSDSEARMMPRVSCWPSM